MSILCEEDIFKGDLPDHGGNGTGDQGVYFGYG